MMGFLGVRHLRTPLMQGRIGVRGALGELQDAMRRAGIADPRLRVTALVTGYLNDLQTTWSDQQPALLDLVSAGMLYAIEGPNELNNHDVGGGAHGPEDRLDRTGAGSFPANFHAWAQAIARFRQAHRALDRVALVAPSISSGLREDYAALPDVSALVDAANVHFYAGGGRQPGFSMPANPAVGSSDNIMAWARAAQHPGGPLWLTETGATTSGNYATDGVSQAQYVLNQFFDFFAAGGTRLFYYQAIDGSGRPGDFEGNFGLFRRDGTPKPAAWSLQRLQALLSPAPPGAPGTEMDLSGLRVTASPGVDSPGAAIRHLVIHHAATVKMVALWNEPPIDDGHGRTIVPNPDVVAVEFGLAVRFRVHDLLVRGPDEAQPAAGAFAFGRRAEVVLRGHAVLLELRS